MPSRNKLGLILSTYASRLIARTWWIALISAAAPASASDRSILRGAPSFSLFGAFFPAWMFCALIGILGAIVSRAAMVSSGLAKVLPFQLFVCASIGLIIGLLVWLVWFGQ